MKTISRYFLLAALCCSLGLSAAPARAEVPVSDMDVTVDVKAVTADAAREKALADAQSKALILWLSQSVPGKAASIVKQMTPDAINGMVRSIEVLDETITKDRYRANVRVSFDPGQLQTLATQYAPENAGRKEAESANIKQQDTKKEPAKIDENGVLVLPLYDRAGGVPQLWEDENPWREAWNRAALASTTARIVLPTGDLADVSAMDATKAFAASFAELKPLAERYGAAQVWVAKASPMEGGLTVTIRRMSAGGIATETMTFSASGQAEKVFLSQAADRVVARLSGKPIKGERGGKEIASGEGAVLPEVTVLVPLHDSKQWLRVREKLQALPMVREVELAALSYTQADVVVRYDGSAADLADAIRKQNMRLEEADGYWTLYPR